MNKNYYGILWGCLAVVVIAGGIYYFVGRENKPIASAPKQPEQIAHQVIVNQTPALEQAISERTQQTQQPQKTQQNVSEATITQTKQTNTQEHTTAQAAQKETSKPTEQASIFQNEPLFVMPLAGNIVMDYSVDHAIYDATLEQYRTNDHISIGAKKGDSVKASEDGTVESVTTDDERGITVVLNHGNGWQTTYSQLQENVVVKKGDTVKKGQEIGFVAEPTKYSVALGEHIDFSIAKNGETVNPKTTVVE